MFILKVSALYTILLVREKETLPRRARNMYGTNVIIPNGD